MEETMLQNAKWICPSESLGEVAPIFYKKFVVTGEVRSAELTVTALGVYEAVLGGQRVGEFIMAPGWTAYHQRLQYQTYDVTKLLSKENELAILVGKGWYRSPLPGFDQPPEYQQSLIDHPAGLLAQLNIVYMDGTKEVIATDESWYCSESPVRFSEIYDGEIYDGSFEPEVYEPVAVFDGPTHTLIPQQGEEVHEQERLWAARIFKTPKGETVVDFGQEITGYVETTLCANADEIVDLSFAEVLDKDGNFYNANYRSAKAIYHYTCREGWQTYKPKLTFWGFRYIRVNEFPGGMEKITPETFQAIVLHSEMKRTGHLSCSNNALNKLFSNIVWGQKGNFFDVPTDCPQRDERLGWTGDAQVFIKTAAYNYDVEKFFTKWLADLEAEQYENGRVAHVVPDVLQVPQGSAAWGDAAVICPWEIYMAYGNPDILKSQFSSMKKWIDYIGSETTTPFLWTGGEHFGDWLALDAPAGSCHGVTREDFIASAFYAHSTSLVIKAGKVLGADVAAYETLYEKIVAAFRKTFPVYETQTECVLAAHFHLAEDCKKAADQLAQMVLDCGVHLQTGFVGTPYLLHVLSSYGHADLAYSLLLREEYPSWLYSVGKGATTVWEHWDSIMEDGGFWSTEMNSFNHYAYGSVADWVYSVAAGIHPVEELPGYAKVRIAPTPDTRLEWLKADFESRHGLISSKWCKEEQFWRYEITTPVDAEIVIDGTSHLVSAGTYYYYSKIK